jgi:signal peptidase I
MASLYSFFIVLLVFPAIIVIAVDSLFLCSIRDERVRLARESGADKSLINALHKRPEWVTWARSLAPWLLAILFIRACVIEPFNIPSTSMYPQLQIGDQIVISKFSYGIRDPLFQNVLIETGSPHRGDVVVFRNPEHPSMDYIKRVIGLPGDTVIYKNKTLSVLPACHSQEPCPVIINFIQRDLNETILDSDGSEMSLYSESNNEVEYVIARTDGKSDDIEDYFRQRDTNEGQFVVPVGHYFMMGDNRDNSRDSRFFGFVEKSTLVGKPQFIALSIPDNAVNSWYNLPYYFKRIGSIK